MNTQEYEFIRKGERWVHAIDGREFKVGKAVYCTFVDPSLALFDDSWDVTYIDGDPNNCAVTNLAKK